MKGIVTKRSDAATCKQSSVRPYLGRRDESSSHCSAALGWSRSSFAMACAMTTVLLTQNAPRSLLRESSSKQLSTVVTAQRRRFRRANTYSYILWGFFTVPHHHDHRDSGLFFVCASATSTATQRDSSKQSHHHHHHHQQQQQPTSNYIQPEPYTRVDQWRSQSTRTIG